MTESCFAVLGIAPTKDEKLIKKAYRKLLHSANPEDDAEGFQRLRSAYEEACRFAKEKERPEEEKSAVDLFVDRCQEVYEDFSRRVNPEEWAMLFDDPVCGSLETESAARHAFLTFLMEHFHFPFEIWKEIDRHFRIQGRRKELMEWFPEEYVDYLQQAVQEDNLLNYALFEEAEAQGSAAYDGYIDTYYRLRQFTDLGLMQQAEEELERLEVSPVYHPYTEIEKARILLYKNRKDEAGEIFLRLGRRYPEEERIVCCMGQYLQMEGRWEEIRGIYDRLLKIRPDSVSARSGKAEELLHDGAYRRAREIILDLLEYNPQDERLMKDLTDANVYMIDELEPQWREKTLDQDGQMDLGWCFYQNMRFEDALAVLQDMEPDAEHQLDYHNLKGRIYLTVDRNEEALEHLVPWLSMILELEPDGSEKTRRRLARLGYAYYTIGIARSAILLRDGSDDEKAWAEAMEYLQMAVAAETEKGQIVSYCHSMADIWRQRKEYGKVVDVCDRILALNQGYYPAVLLRQEACLHLGMYQEVADDYQRAVHMYPYFGRPYATLAQMYFLLGDYDKVKEVLRIAEENKVDSDGLHILEARYRAVTAQKEKDLEEALAILDGLWEKGWSSLSDVEQDEWGEVAYRRGLILSDLGRFDEAAAALQESLEGKEDEPFRLFSYASVLMQSGRYDEAIDCLKRTLQAMPEDAEVLYRIGCCHMLKKEYVRAVEYFQRTLEKNPDSLFASNNAGVCYLSMNMPEKAEPFFLEAVRQMKYETTPLPYNNLARCYRMMRDYDAARICYKKNMELFPDHADVYLLMGDFYRENEQYDEAVDIYREAIRRIGASAPLELELFRTYGMKGDREQVEALGKDLEERYPEHGLFWQLAGEVWLFGFSDSAAANRYLKKALEIGAKEQDSECIRGSLYLMGRSCLFSGQKEEAEKYFRKYLRACRGEDGRSGSYEETPGERGRRKFRIGCVYLFLGDDEEAERCFDAMDTEENRCDGCSRPGCYERLIADAMLLWVKGEHGQSLEKYRQAAGEVPDDLEHRFEYRQMKKWEESL